MSKVEETVKFLCEQIDECDDLIVEISQLRYRLEAILHEIDRRPDKSMPRHYHKRCDKSIA